MKYSYGWEKLHLTMLSLTGAGTQRRRLIIAVSNHLIRIRPENDLPESIRKDFILLMQILIPGYSLSCKGSVESTVNRLSNDELSEAVSKLISYYHALCNYCEI